MPDFANPGRSSNVETVKEAGKIKYKVNVMTIDRFLDDINDS